MYYAIAMNYSLPCMRVIIVIWEIMITLLIFYIWLVGLAFKMQGNNHNNKQNMKEQKYKFDIRNNEYLSPVNCKYETMKKDKC